MGRLSKKGDIMKCKRLFIAAFVAASCCSVQAADKPGVHDLKYRSPEKFHEFQGMRVRNLQDEELGRVTDITVDLQNARLVEVLVTRSSGFLGLSSKTTAVPARALTTDFAPDTLRLDVSKEKFQSAPKFNLRDIEGASQPERVAGVLRYFGFEPWFYLKGQTVEKNAEIVKLGHVHRAHLLLGFPITNTRGEYLGRVGLVTVDLPTGRVLHVIMVTNAAVSPRSSIQARALRFNPEKTGLVLDDSLVELAGEPHFKWLDENHQNFQQETYVNRDADADNGFHSRQNKQEGIVGEVAVMKQGESFRDRKKTARILQAIQSDPELSANARNVEVVTYNGQTTLRGHVNSDSGSRRIESIAAKAGRAENVSNLLKVRPLYAPSR